MLRPCRFASPNEAAGAQHDKKLIGQLENIFHQAAASSGVEDCGA
jgi:hypothetical protein